MGQIEDLRVFAAVVENRSISKAAQQLNIAKSAVSRRLGLLEDRFGSRLIERSPGVWSITAKGRELYQRAVLVVDDMDELEADFTDTSNATAGPLTVSIPRSFGLGFLAPALIDFKTRHPDIQFTVDLDDRNVDLTSENYDFAIRITPNIESGIVAEKLGTSLQQLCASPAYLTEHGVPETIEDLSNHALLYYGPGHRGTWTFAGPGESQKHIEFQPVLNSNNGEFLMQAAQKDMGIARLPDFISTTAIRNGRLVSIPLGAALMPLGIYLVHSEDRRLNRRMRLFAQDMKRVCASMPAAV
ncbi:MAG: LysR family transcriptional regulator [Marinosulfonomonas sp.]